MLKKVVTWGFVALVAILVMAFIALSIVEETTADMGEAAVAQVRARAHELTLPQPDTPSPDATEPHTPLAQSSTSGDCEGEQERWAAQEALSRATLQSDEVIRKNSGSYARWCAFYPEYDEHASNTLPEFWPDVVRFVDANRGTIRELVRELALRDPDCGYLQRWSVSDRFQVHYTEQLIDMDRALAVCLGEHDAVLQNLRASISLAYTGAGFGFPDRIAPAQSRVILDALASDAVEEQTLQDLLTTMQRFRNRNFMFYYVHSFPHIPFGAAVQETSPIMRGFRAAIHAIQQPVLNGDAARFAPILETLAELATRPYYTVVPELDTLTETYDLRPHDRHSYLNESGARASIVNLVHTVFPRNAASQAQIDLFSLAIALKIFHCQTGKYPEALDELSNIPNAPSLINPVDGVPYHYQPVGNGYRLGFVLAAPVRLDAFNQSGTTLRITADQGILTIEGDEE